MNIALAKAESRVASRMHAPATMKRPSRMICLRKAYANIPNPKYPISSKPFSESKPLKYGKPIAFHPNSESAQATTAKKPTKYQRRSNSDPKILPKRTLVNPARKTSPYILASTGRVHNDPLTAGP